MKHDEERPRSTRLITDAPVPGHWIDVLATMRANPFTRLSLDEVLTEAARITIVSPSAEVAHTCFAALLDAAADRIDVIPAEQLVAGDVSAGAWVFLPHRQDGWDELEATSARVRADLVRENTARAKADKLTLIEYGINLWLWAEPPSGGGDPVCHAGELISWESAWTLSGNDAPRDTDTSGEARESTPPAARPPIYFGLPELLRRRRRDG